MKLAGIPRCWGSLSKKGALALALGLGLFTAPASADVDFNITMNYDTTGTGAYGQYYGLFVETFDNIEGILQTWSGPRAIESLYSGFTIDVAFEGLDGAGGTIAQAGPTNIITWGGGGKAKNSARGAVATSGAMSVDIDDIDYFASTGQLQDIIMHEAFHALGFGTLWQDFGYLDSTGFGYIGPEALAQYREGTGNPYELFVPLERTGGAGTAGGHWDSANEFFVNSGEDKFEIMTGYVAPAGVNSWLSDVTLGQFRDLGYGVPSLDGGVDDGDWPTGGGDKPWDPPTGDDDGGVSDGPSDPDSPWDPGDGDDDGSGGTGGKPSFPTRGDGGWVGGGRGGFSAVPEPGSGIVLAAFGLMGALGVRRRKS